MNLLEEIKRDARSAMTLADWLGDGGVPVAPELAESRSVACVYGNCGGKCHMNVAPNWWNRFKNKIALAIREQLAVKHQLGLFLSNDSKLNVCKVCGCCLQLIVWTGIERIEEHMTEAKMVQFPDFCWQKREVLEKRNK